MKPRLGRTSRLSALRRTEHGLYLDGGALGEILLPGGEVPEGAGPGSEIEVFLLRDSEDRLVATTRRPLAEAGRFACLEVVSVNPRIGAFLDWGLPKELLLPFGEQSRRVREGERVVVRVLVDPKSDRIVATARLDRFLDKTRPDYRPGQPVRILVLERTPLGYAAVVEGAHRGLIHADEAPRPLLPGDAPECYIREVRPDGKIGLSLRPVGYSRITGLAGRVLAELERGGGRIPLGDRSPPEAVEAAFGASKKAFKQALGSLYRQRLVRVGDEETVLIDTSGGKRPEA